MVEGQPSCWEVRLSPLPLHFTARSGVRGGGTRWPSLLWRSLPGQHGQAGHPTEGPFTPQGAPSLTVVPHCLLLCLLSADAGLALRVPRSLGHPGKVEKP